MDTTVSLITIIILLIAFAISVIATQIVRARPQAVTLRSHPAFNALPLMISEALEQDRSTHFSFGSTSLTGLTTPLLLANAETFTRLATRAALGARPPLITTSEASTVPVSYDVLRRAYRASRRLNTPPLQGVHWYPEGGRSLAFAGALTTVMLDRHVGANVLLGSFGTEISLILDASARRRLPAVAASDQLEGQAVAYAMSDEALIGEEMFAAGAYLGAGAAHTGAVVALDVLRILLIALLAALTLYELSGGALLTNLLRGGS